jgi:hypothetical protein
MPTNAPTPEHIPAPHERTPPADDDKLREREAIDPGAGFTEESQERSRNTEFHQPPRQDPPGPTPGPGAGVGASPPGAPRHVR